MAEIPKISTYAAFCSSSPVRGIRTRNSDDCFRRRDLQCRPDTRYRRRNCQSSDSVSHSFTHKRTEDSAAYATDELDFLVIMCLARFVLTHILNSFHRNAGLNLNPPRISGTATKSKHTFTYGRLVPMAMPPGIQE